MTVSQTEIEGFMLKRKLKSFAKSKGITFRDFGKIAGLHHVSICNLCNGKVIHLETLVRINHFTEGLVTYEEMIKLMGFNFPTNLKQIYEEQSKITASRIFGRPLKKRGAE